jgi:hypothetical protein
VVVAVPSAVRIRAVSAETSLSLGAAVLQRHGHDGLGVTGRARTKRRDAVRVRLALVHRDAFALGVPSRNARQVGDRNAVDDLAAGIVAARWTRPDADDCGYQARVGVEVLPRDGKVRRAAVAHAASSHAFVGIGWAATPPLRAKNDLRQWCRIPAAWT